LEQDDDDRWRLVRQGRAAGLCQNVKVSELQEIKDTAWGAVNLQNAQARKMVSNPWYRG